MLLCHFFQSNPIQSNSIQSNLTQPMRSHCFGTGISVVAAQLRLKITCRTHTHRTTLLYPLRASHSLIASYLCSALSSRRLYLPSHNLSSKVTMVATAPVLEGDMLESSSPSDILFWLVSSHAVMSCY
jgi:hypothetical protein